jgi:hypothetical protein
MQLRCSSTAAPHRKVYKKLEHCIRRYNHRKEQYLGISIAGTSNRFSVKESISVFGWTHCD